MHRLAKLLGVFIQISVQCYFLYRRGHCEDIERANNARFISVLYNVVARFLPRALRYSDDIRTRSRADWVAYRLTLPCWGRQTAEVTLISLSSMPLPDDSDGFTLHKGETVAKCSCRCGRFSVFRTSLAHLTLRFSRLKVDIVSLLTGEE